MSRSLSVVVAGVFLLSIVSGSRADFPASGQDTITDTKGFFKFELLDGSVVNFPLETAEKISPDPPNETVIGRSDPLTDNDLKDPKSGVPIDNTGFTMMPGSGLAAHPPLLPEDWPESDPARREVHTEILSLELTGMDKKNNGPYTLRVGKKFWDSVKDAGCTDLYGNSFGEVTSKSDSGVPGDDFPAQGVFNVCAEFETPMGPLYNRTPMMIRKTELLGFPPDISTAGTAYIHDPSFIGVTFFTADGMPVGKLLSAGHGAQSIPEDTPDMLAPLRCPVSFTVDSESHGLANILPNQVNVDATAGPMPPDARLDVTVYVSRSGLGPVGLRPGLPDGTNALSGSFTGVVTAGSSHFEPADRITSFSYGRDGTIPVLLQKGKRRGNIYFSLDRTSRPPQGVCFGESVAANVYAAVTPPFGSYVDVVHTPAIPGTSVLVVDNNELGLAPKFCDNAEDDEVTGLELKDEIQIGPTKLLWFGTLDGPANAAIGGNAATIYVYDPATGPFKPGNLGVYAVSGNMGLLSTDEIDALVLSDVEAGHTPFDLPTPDGVLQKNAGDEALFSLGRGSPTLAALGASAADIFYTDFDGTFSLFIPAKDMGLNPAEDGDNIDAADVKPNPQEIIIPVASEWGVVVLALGLLVGVALKFGRRRQGEVAA